MPAHWSRRAIYESGSVIGGFHLRPVFEPIFDRICADLAAPDPVIVIPDHCTGWRGQHTREGVRRTIRAQLRGTRFEL